MQRSVEPEYLLHALIREDRGNFPRPMMPYTSRWPEAMDSVLYTCDEKLRSGHRPRVELFTRQKGAGRLVFVRMPRLLPKGSATAHLTPANISSAGRIIGKDRGCIVS